MTEKSKNIAFYLLTGLLVLSSFWSIYKYGVDVPHWDDHAVRNFVDGFQLKSFFEIFSFHNEHRIGVTRIAALNTDWVAGRLNYKALMYTGQLALVGLLGIYIYLKERFKFPALLLFIIALFIFNNSTFENSLWAMAGMQNHWVLFLSVGSLLLLIKSQFTEEGQKLWFVLSVLSSFLAMYSSANGLLTAPIGLLLLFFIGKRKPMLIWLAIHVVLVATYFIGFQSFGMSKRPHLEDFFLNLFALAGSLATPIANINSPMGLTQIIGLINIILAVWLFFKLLFRKNNQTEFLSYIALTSFYLGTMVLISVSRSDYERQVLLTSKYKVYSLLLLANTLFFWIKKEKIEAINKSFAIILVSGLLVFLNLQFSFLDDLKATFRERMADQTNLQLLGVPYLPENNALTEAILKESFITDASKIDSIALQKESIDFFENDLRSESENFVLAKGPTPNQLVPVNPDYVFFKSQSKGTAQLFLYNFPSDIYQLHYLELTDGKVKIYNAQKTIRIEGVPYESAPKNW
ncbi:hypothetical protein [Jiulongibacter sediminis]|uniref:Glycosyltransferase RgtA/B/C/D-like domain-containing protein n=1 Tax=Jiulongibacter sediminis TaxID=1605367 RepID=A0A0N8HA52_9BACT|nr:hypothetical protein [Jiulongibacter sediminis]KPM49204.1 hypothetical protein AFM12_00745 [Jiulongibacter sediminis]TBX26259.1 hypothetical protein TK44_00745 [Jiulongibacter sediminis]